MELFRPPVPAHPGARTSPATYYIPATHIATSGTAAIVANVLYFVPFLIPGAAFDRIGVEVTTGSAGAARLGLYTNASGGPLSLILDCGTVDVTSTAVVEASFTAVSLPNDWVWAAIVSNATPTLRNGGQGAQSIIGCAAPGTAARGLSQSFTYGALPASVAATSITNAAPIITLRKS